MKSNELLIFLENLFISRWTDSKDDLNKVYSSKTFNVKKILKNNKLNTYSEKIIYKESFSPDTKKKLNLISSIIFLRNIIINNSEIWGNQIKKLPVMKIKPEYILKLDQIICQETTYQHQK